MSRISDAQQASPVPAPKPVELHGEDPVSYTHLDVYKRQLGVKVKSIGIGNAVGKVTNTIPRDVVIELFRLGQVLANERGVVRQVQMRLAHPRLPLSRHFAQTIA